MAYIPGFEYDIFISYAHVDNLGDVAWVECFQKALEISLAQKLGRMGMVKLWRDERLEGNQLFDETIETAIRNSAIFLALTSNGYLASSYCRLELQKFQQKAAEECFGQKVGDRSRIYNLLLSNIPESRWPSEFGRISGFPFHDLADEEVVSAEAIAEPTDPKADTLRFKKQLKKLADSLCTTLTVFKETAEKAEAPPSLSTETEPAEPTGPCVFLADVADTLVSVRKRLITELERKGITVETAVPPPYAAAAHASKVDALAKQAVLSVHLLDQFPGREIEGEPGITYPQKQVELIKDAVRPQFIWVQKELDLTAIDDERHRTLIDQLENGKRSADAKFNFVRTSSTSLLPQVLERLEQLQRGPVPSDEPEHAVLLDTHLKDQAYAFDLGRVLLQNSIQPYINPQEDDPNKNLDAFEARLKNVSTLVILFGATNESWVRSRLLVALQLSAAKNLPLRSFCVLAVPPTKDGGSIRFSMGPIRVQLLDNSRSEQLDASVMASLLAAARDGAPA